MSQQCKICASEDREKIDEDLVQGVPIRIIADRYGFSLGTINRHKQHMIQKLSPEKITTTVLEPTAQVIRSQTTPNGFDIGNLFQKMQVMVEKSFQIVDKYEMLDPDGKFIGTPADVKAKAAGINSLRGSLEFISKMFGLISPDGVSPGYLQLQDKYEKQKQFILEHLCDNCRTEFLKHLEGT